jgi:hypothetical protein
MVEEPSIWQATNCCFRKTQDVQLLFMYVPGYIQLTCFHCLFCFVVVHCVSFLSQGYASIFMDYWTSSSVFLD